MALSVALALGAFLLPPVVVAAESGFQVSSYIPQHFRDFTWYVQGNGSFIWNKQAVTYAESPGTRLRTDESGYSSSDGGASASTSLDYRYETIPRLFRFTCDLSVAGNATKRTPNESFEVDTTGVIDKRSEENEGHNYRLFVDPQVSFANFLNDELFVGADLSGYFSYQRYPKYTTTRTTNISTHPDSASAYEYLTYNQVQITRSPQKVTEYSFNGELSIGRGHIYYGNYASTAMYLVDELRKNGFIKQEPSESQMQQLTEIIYQRRLKHYTDYRIRLIESQQAIMDYLKSEQIATIETPLMPLIVQDVWNYFPYYDRAFGFQVRAGVGLEYLKNSTKYFSDNFVSYNQALRHRDSLQALDSSITGSNWHQLDFRRVTLTLPYLFARANYQKPINLKWQWEVRGDARLFVDANAARRTDQRQAGQNWTVAGVDTLRDSSFVGRIFAQEYSYKNFYSASISSQVRYIYSSRTNYVFAASLGYGHLDQDLKIPDRQWEDSNVTFLVRNFKSPGFSNLRFSASASATYRISIPTTLYASVLYTTGSDPRSLITGAYKYKPQAFQISVTLAHYIY